MDLVSLFRSYYESHPPRPPKHFEKREFGFGCEKKIEFRHTAFKSEDEFKRFFITNTPLYASYSVAYYKFPDARPMEKKVFLGADLVFEFDSHHEWIDESEWERMKGDVFKLLAFLQDDFGFDDREIKITFSGSRGFHIHVISERVFGLDQDARIEMIDYIQGKGVDFSRPKGVWKKRVLDWLERALEEGNFRKAKREWLRDLIKKGQIEQIPERFYKKVVGDFLKKESLDFDRNVTIDIHRLIRIPTTLHGGTGLLCMEIRDLDRFDPTLDPVVFDDEEVEIEIIKEVPTFVLKDQTFGPFKVGKVRVPLFVGVFLVGKGYGRF